MGVEILIEYPDGTSERLACKLAPGVIDVGGEAVPGFLVGEPSERCPTRSDFFLCALGEGNQTAGFLFHDPEDTYPGEQAAFRWRLVPAAVDTEDGYRFWLHPSGPGGAVWADSPDLGASDMFVDCGPDGLPAFEEPMGLRPVEDLPEALAAGPEAEQWLALTGGGPAPATPSL